MLSKTEKEWNGQDVIIIGGGSSLTEFPFEQLAGRNVIGVNEAFRFGTEIVPRNIFGDIEWWNRNKWTLEDYALKKGGVLYSISPGTERLRMPYLRQLTRISLGISLQPDKLAWNYSTGAAAVNLAVLLGARRIFLLGFDMAAPNGESHWHRYRKKVTGEESFARFMKGFEQLAAQLKKNLPAVKVYNVGDGSSRLSYFEKISFEEFWNKTSEPVYANHQESSEAESSVVEEQRDRPQRGKNLRRTRRDSSSLG